MISSSRRLVTGKKCDASEPNNKKSRNNVPWKRRNDARKNKHKNVGDEIWRLVPMSFRVAQWEEVEMERKVTDRVVMVLRLLENEPLLPPAQATGAVQLPVPKVIIQCNHGQPDQEGIGE